MLYLIRLYPEQVSRQWESISPAIESSLPPITPRTLDRMNRVFESILAGKIQVYMFANEDKKVRGIVATSVVEAVDGSERQMLIYSLYGYLGVTMEEFNEGFGLLKELCKGHDCSAIVAYTGVPELVAYVKRNGGSAETFLRMEV